MDSLIRCEECGKLISVRFPMHECAGDAQPTRSKQYGQRKTIRAYWGSSSEYGGCNACNRHFVNGHSPRKHRVLNIDFLTKALSFRLCTECVELLREQINLSDVKAYCSSPTSNE